MTEAELAVHTRGVRLQLDPPLKKGNRLTEATLGHQRRGCAGENAQQVLLDLRIFWSQGMRPAEEIEGLALFGSLPVVERGQVVVNVGIHHAHGHDARV